MAAFSHCAIELEGITGVKLSVAEIDSIEKAIKKRIAMKAKERRGMAAEEQHRKAAEDLGEELTVEAVIAKRNSMLNTRRFVQESDALIRNFSNDPSFGIEALTVGINQVREGGRLSIAAEQRALAEGYKGGIIADMTKLDAWTEFVKGVHDRDIFEALFRMDDEVPDYKGLDPKAVEMAKVVRKWQEVARLDANGAGGFIGRLKGYVTTQSHNMWKIRKASARTGGQKFEFGDAANRKAWTDYTLERLDHARTFEGMDADEIANFMKLTYDALASGLHMRRLGDADAKNVDVPSGLESIAKKLSQHRLLHFKDGAAAFEYMDTFGHGSLAQGVGGHLSHMAENTGLMRRLGPNARLTYDRLIETGKKLSKKQSLKEQAKMNRPGRFNNLFAELDGTTRIPGSAMGAQISAGIRAVQSMAKLGGATITAFTDIPIAAASLRHDGVNYFDAWGMSLKSVLRPFGDEDRLRIASMLSIALDGMNGDMASRFNAGDGPPGMIAGAMQQFFKFNGLSFWTDSLRVGVALQMSNHVASFAGRSFDALPATLKRTFGQFGILAEEWDAMRGLAVETVGDHTIFAPEAARNLTDNQVMDLIQSVRARRGEPGLKADGKKLPRRMIEEKRQELERKFRGYFSDRSDHAVITPDARTRAFMLRGTQPGTVEGEALRFIMQFKAFPLAVAQKVVGKEIYGRGDQSGKFLSALAAGNGEFLGLANVLVTTMAFGYLSKSTKDILKGREPRTPTDLDSALRIAGAAMVQGGGAGIYGDFLFGEWKTRYGGGPISSALGPTVGTIEDVVDLFGRIRAGDDVAAKAFRVMISNTPYANLFYTRMALDYAVIYRIQESLNPGYLRRMEKRIKKQNNQSFILPPSRAVAP